MESVGILRALWRRWILVGFGLALAIGSFAFLVYGRGGASTSGFAVERVLVDTPKSLVVDADAKGAEAIVTRAQLLGSLIASDEARTATARAAGLRPAALGVIAPGTTAPVALTPLAEQALEVTKPTQPYIVTVSEDPRLPILTIYATAPNPKGARRLADATAKTLTSLGREAVVVGDDLAVKSLGEAEAGTKSIGTGKLKALIVSVVLLVLWCTLIVVFDGLSRRRYQPSQWADNGRGAAA